MSSILPPDATPIGIVREYKDLIAALDRQRRRRGMTMLDLDARAGFYEGYSSHLFAWRSRHGKTLGAVSLPLVLEALGVGLVVIEIDPVEMALPVPPEQLSLPLPIPEQPCRSYRELTARCTPAPMVQTVSAEAA